MTTKIQLKAGDVELLYETDTPIAVSDVRDFISQIHDVAEALGHTKSISTDESQKVSAEASFVVPDSPKIELHLNTIADRLGVKNSAQLAIAAAAHMQIVEGKESFTRNEWLKAMQTATNFYNKNMGSNFSATVARLTGVKVNQLSNDKFALKSNELSDLRGKLAE